jgi:hypothetical protein
VIARVFHLGCVVAVILAAGCGGAPKPAVIGTSTTKQVLLKADRATIDLSIKRGVGFLIATQHADGSWGTGTESHGNEVVAAVPGSHQAFKVAVTSLVVMALRESKEAGFDGVGDSHRRGVEFLVTQGQAKREEGALLYTFWANVYATQALSAEIIAGSTDPRVRQMAEWHIDRLNRYATYIGGWNYYDFVSQTQSPSMGPTSFGSGAGLYALWHAKQAGLSIPPLLAERTVKRLEEMRLSTGAYLYGHDYRRLPRAVPAHMVPGSLGRTQVSNLGLMVWGSQKITDQIARDGLRPFFADHAAMEMGRKRPLPHESWYQVSGYYYYFGQYYAAQLMTRLGGDTLQAHAQELAGKHIMQHQESDGSWWDYPMWGYHKPYGTAFALMALLDCREAVSH